MKDKTLKVFNENMKNVNWPKSVIETVDFNELDDPNLVIGCGKIDASECASDDDSFSQMTNEQSDYSSWIVGCGLEADVIAAP
jgi:hypothetical protein